MWRVKRIRDNWWRDRYCVITVFVFSASILENGLLESEDKSKGVYDFLFQLALRDRPHGNALWYAEPHVAALQLIVERITGRSFIEEFGDRIWSRLGAERSGLAITDRLGTATNGTGLCVTARDAARFGQMMLDRGRVEGEEVVPAGFIDDILENPNSEIVNAESNLSGVTLPGTGYRSLFWTNASGGPQPFLAAVGLYSQHIRVDPSRNMVVVKFSTHPTLSVITSDLLALTSLCAKLDSL